MSTNRIIKMRKAIPAALLLFGVFGVTACRQDMHDNPKYKPYRDGSIRELPDGVVARGSMALNPPAPVVQKGQMPAPAASPQAPGTPAAAAAAASAPAPIPVGEDGFPFKVTREIIERGQSRYNISCLPCHGQLGDGNGMIVQRGFRRASSYLQDRLVKAPSSYYYDVITNGFGAMASYADQLTPEDRWKVIAYIRVLQLSQRANVAELADEDRRKLEETERKEAHKEGSHSSGGHSN